MFSKLIDYSYKRSPLQAVGFYLTYVFIIAFSSIAASGIIGKSIALDDNGNYLVGVVTATIFAFILALAIAINKNIYKDYKIIILVVISPIIAFYAGTIAGLLPVTYLTTLDKNT